MNIDILFVNQPFQISQGASPFCYVIQWRQSATNDGCLVINTVHFNRTCILCSWEQNAVAISKGNINLFCDSHAQVISNYETNVSGLQIGPLFWIPACIKTMPKSFIMIADWIRQLEGVMCYPHYCESKFAQNSRHHIVQHWGTLCCISSFWSRISLRW